MLQKLWEWLRGRGAGRPGIEPHPDLSGDRGERRMEHELFEGQTRHVGSTADVSPNAADRREADG